MNFTQQIKGISRTGNAGAQMQIMVKQIDKQTSFINDPNSIYDMEKYPQDIHMSSTDQAMKLLDVF